MFNLALSRRSPYVSQLKPKVAVLRKGYAQIDVANRRAVHNHLGTVDSNALFTLSQLVTGLALETAIPKDRRWIPIGAELEYLKLAKSSVSAVCDCSELDFYQDNLNIDVIVQDSNGEHVQKSAVKIHLSSRKSLHK